MTKQKYQIELKQSIFGGEKTTFCLHKVIGELQMVILICMQITDVSG